MAIEPIELGGTRTPADGCRRYRPIAFDQLWSAHVPLASAEFASAIEYQ